MSAYWPGDWPNLNSVSIVLDGAAVDILEPDELGVLYRIVWFIAAQSVHTYSEPSDDPALPENRAHNVARCSRATWLAMRDHLSPFFHIGDDGRWRLKDHSCIRLSRDIQRSAVPINVRATVLRRDGKRCVYCGDDDGPFHFDHLWPVSKGGGDEPNNIVVACATCNLSKGDKTLREWRG